jgi:glyoxylase-like metal-dependent hydrolase (beta-lactamase superfamily II)
MRVHALMTGRIGVKSRYRAAAGRTRIARLTSALLDSQFVEIPVFAWAIEHPEGVIVIDVGETARTRDPGYFPAVQRPYWLSQYRFQLTPDDEIGPQLRARGIAPGDVRWVVLTHAHFDHTDGLYHFPNAEVIISRREWGDVQRFRSAHFGFPSKYPPGIRPTLVDYVPDSVGAFTHSWPLTRAGDVRVVPTPGHTPGHQSVILHEDGHDLFFAADASFDLASLHDGTLDAPAFNSGVTLETRQRILRYAAQRPTVYLTTHDWDTARRLDTRTLVYAETPTVG